MQTLNCGSLVQVCQCPVHEYAGYAGLQCEAEVVTSSHADHLCIATMLLGFTSSMWSHHLRLDRAL